VRRGMGAGRAELASALILAAGRDGFGRVPVEDRRRSARYTPPEALFGRIKTVLPARILDISPGGMRVEVGSALRPAADCDVVVPAGTEEFRLRARVLRCRAFAGDPNDTGGIVFRAGLEFVEVSEEAAHALEDAYGKVAKSEAKANGGDWPPRNGGPIRIRVKLEDVTPGKSKKPAGEKG
jgi:hypothetical protein